MPLRFLPGDRVSIDPPGRGGILGVVTMVRGRYVTVRDRDGMEWHCRAADLYARPDDEQARAAE